jgi:hypothetical protein
MITSPAIGIETFARVEFPQNAGIPLFQVQPL